MSKQTVPRRFIEDERDWPRWVYCFWCRRWRRAETPQAELEWWRDHAACVPLPVRDAMEAGWGQEGVHAGGLDPYE